MWDLQEYTPETPKESSFEPFKYEGAVLIESAEVNPSAKASEHYNTDEGADIQEMKLVVLEGEHAKRCIFKKFNLDTTKGSGKENKLPVQKLADQISTLGLEFNNVDELREVNKKLTGMKAIVKCWKITIENKDIQMCNIKGEFVEELKFD